MISGCKERTRVVPGPHLSHEVELGRDGRVRSLVTATEEDELPLRGGALGTAHGSLQEGSTCREEAIMVKAAPSHLKTHDSLVAASHLLLSYPHSPFSRTAAAMTSMRSGVSVAASTST